jgi:hypothetical protein
MPVDTDFFAQKTPDELKFFIDNPTFHEADLVQGARRELQRRGLWVSTPTPAASPEQHPMQQLPDASDSAGRTGFWLGLVALVVVLVGGYLWNSQRQADRAAELAAWRWLFHKYPPKLETVETNALPDFSAATKASVSQQLAAVPEAEKATLPDQPLRQYRELSRRFWAAETMSEYLADQARAGKPNTMLTQQALLAREAWEQWNKAAVYSYKFGPVMTEHLDWMGRVASHQQHIMADLPDLVAKQELLTTPEFIKRDDEVQDLMSGLLPMSPVTGKPYRKLHREIKVQL